MRRALLALIVALAVVPVANDACCDLDQPLAPEQTASVEPACSLHARGGSESPEPRRQPATPARCSHDLSIDRAGLVKTVTVSAPVFAVAIIAAPTPSPSLVLSALSPAAPHHAPPRRASRPDVLRI